MATIYRLHNRNFKSQPRLFDAMLADLMRIYPEAKRFEVRASVTYGGPVLAIVDEREVAHWTCSRNSTLSSRGWSYHPGVDTYDFRAAPSRPAFSTVAVARR